MSFTIVLYIYREEIAPNLVVKWTMHALEAVLITYPFYCTIKKTWHSLKIYYSLSMTKLKFKFECIVKKLNEIKQKKLIVKVTQYYSASLVDQILAVTISPISFSLSRTIWVANFNLSRLMRSYTLNLC